MKKFAAVLKETLSQFKVKKTEVAREKEAEIREVARLGQKFVVMELS